MSGTVRDDRCEGETERGRPLAKLPLGAENWKALLERAGKPQTVSIKK